MVITIIYVVLPIKSYNFSVFRIKDGIKNITWIITDKSNRKVKLLIDWIVETTLDPKKESKYIQNINTIDVRADLISFFIIFVGDTRFELVTPCLSMIIFLLYSLAHFKCSIDLRSYVSYISYNS